MATPSDANEKAILADIEAGFEKLARDPKALAAYRNHKEETDSYLQTARKREATADSPIGVLANAWMSSVPPLGDRQNPPRA